jgi:hypothetical protein
MIITTTMAINSTTVVAQLNSILDSYSFAESNSSLSTTSLLSFSQGHRGSITEKKEILNLRIVFSKLVFLLVDGTGSICYASAPICPFAFLSSQGMKEDCIWFNPTTEARKL